MRGRLLRALRDATSAQHRELEKLLPAFDSISASEYAEHLCRLASVHVPLERRLFATHDWATLGLPDAAARKRAPLLEDDLRILGIDPARIATAVTLPDVGSLPRALGALYVLEGSRLGGQVLARSVATAAGPVPTTFFVGAADQTAPRWRTFRHFAERCAGRAPAIADASAAAIETFAAFAAVLSRRDERRAAG